MKKYILPIIIILLGVFLGFRIVSTQIKKNGTDNLPLVVSGDLQIAEFKIEDMNCLPCMTGAKLSMKSAEGVVDIEMAIDDSDAYGKIIYDLEKTNLNDIFKRIEPYTPEVIKSSPTNSIKID